MRIRFLNDLLTLFLTGALVLGFGGRIWMFLIGWGLTGSAGFTLGGTLEVVLFGGLVGLFSGVIYLLLIKGRIKRSLFEGTYFGLGVFIVLSFLPLEGKGAIHAYDQVYWFPILFGFATLFWLFGIASVFAISKNFPIFRSKTP